ncbi:MAG: endospore germination permease [Bacillota bacterium]|nr:endospore germination permease [Bacillota bacterium]MDD4263710.1 endospore germination permease [Bacillota bacterium]
MLVEKQKISGPQLTFLVSAQLMGNTLLIDPASYAGHLGWVVSLIGGLFAILLYWLYISLGNRFPNLSPSEYSQILYGKFLGKVLTIGHVIMFFVISMTYFIDYVAYSSVNLPETPKTVFILGQMLVVVCALYLGLESFARTTFVIISFSLFSFVLSFLLAIKEMDLILLLPLATDKPKEFWQTLFTVLSYPYAQSVLILWLLPLVPDQKQAKKGFFRGVILGSSVVFLTSLRNVLVYGDGVKNELFPFLSVARNISIGTSITHVEIIMSLTLNLIGFTGTTLFLYVIILTFAQVFNLRSYRSLLIPLFFTVIFVANKMPLNIGLIAWFRQHYLRYFTLVFSFLFPIISLVRSFFLKPKPTKKSKSRILKR